MIILRKSPIRHDVGGHYRQGKWVRTYVRGRGTGQHKTRKSVVVGNGPIIRKVEYFSYDSRDVTIGEERRRKEKFPYPMPEILKYHRHVPTDRLYHVTDRADEILESETIRPGWGGSLSLTASDRLSVISPERNPKDFRIALDFRKLQRDYPNLVPVYYSRIDEVPEDIEEFYRMRGIDLSDPQKFTKMVHHVKNFSHENEWSMFGTIENVSKYIVGIEERIG